MSKTINHTLICLRRAAECKWIAANAPLRFRAHYIRMVRKWNELADEALPKKKSSKRLLH